MSPTHSADEATSTVLPADLPYRGTARRVLEAATTLFATRGFHGTSMRDLADAVGLRAASLYEHFGSKDDILAAILTVGHEAVRDRLIEAIEAAGPDPARQLDAAVRALVQQLCAWPELSVTVTNEVRSLDPGHAASTMLARDEVSVRLAAVLHRGIEGGVFADRNIALLVAAIGSMAIRTPFWFVASADYGVEDLARDYAELALVLATTPRDEGS